MRIFIALWIAQTFSLLGSQLTGFGFGVSLFQSTHSTSVSGLLYAAAMVPQLLLAPFAGVLVDRYGAKTTMLLGSAGAGGCTLALALATKGGATDVVTILALVALASAMRATEYPGFQAATTLLAPPSQLGRANGLVQLSFGIPLLIGPFVASHLLGKVGMVGILVLDAATFAFAIVTLALLRIPRVSASSARSSMQREMMEAWRFILERPGLLGLLACFFVLNFNMGIVQVLLTPLVLGFADATTLGSILSTGGIGMLLGALLMTAWGGPKRRIAGVLGAAFVQGSFFCLGAARPSTLLVSIGAFGALATVPIMAASNIAIWQRKVPLGAQGRVAALRSVIAISAMPIGFLSAGPLVDHVFEPSMREGRTLARLFANVLGEGPGRGAALMFATTGLLTMTSAIAAYLMPRIRNVEDELSDNEVPL